MAGADSDDPVTERSVIEKYIRRYVDLAVIQSSSSTANSKMGAKTAGLSNPSQHRNHYHLVLP